LALNTFNDSGAGLHASDYDGAPLCITAIEGC
jgi:hypothetical protein